MPAVREVWADGPGLLSSALRHWLVIIGAAVAVGAAAYVMAASEDPVYEATAELSFSDFHVERLDPDDTRPPDTVRFLNARVTQVRSTPTMERASELLGGSVGPAELQAAISVHAEPEFFDFMLIRARAGTADDAVTYANAVGEAYQEVAAEQRRADARAAIAELELGIGRLEERIAELDAADDPDAAQPTTASTQRRVALSQLLELSRRRERLEVLAEVADAGVSSFRPALPPDAPISPRPRPAGALGAFAGLAFASAYAYWREGRGLARAADDLRARITVPLLAEVPRARERRRPSPSRSGVLVDRVPPSYEFLAVALDRALGEQPAHSVVFAGVRARRGQAAVAMHAALALCQEKRRVVLVDADLRERRLTRMWHLSDSLGLADLKDPRVSFQRVSTLAGVVGGDATWAFVPAGTPQAAPARLRPSTVQRLLQEVSAARRDGQSVQVVLHGPPILEMADVSTIARLADGVVLTVTARTRVDDVRRAVETVEVAGGRVLGVVFVGGRRAGRRRSLHAASVQQGGIRARSASVS